MGSTGSQAGPVPGSQVGSGPVCKRDLRPAKKRGSTHLIGGTWPGPQAGQVVHNFYFLFFYFLFFMFCFCTFRLFISLFLVLFFQILASLSFKF